MKLSEIKPGMEGEGKTIFKGSNIETFNFKVLGVLDKFVSDKNLIIAELFAPELNEGGVIAGMSGSPVYIDGKLIGSVSYGLSNFSKKPIAGITPIEDILKISAQWRPGRQRGDLRHQDRFQQGERQARGRGHPQELVSRMNFSPARAFSPIKLFASSSGFCPEALHPLQEVFVPLQNVGVVQGPEQEQAEPRHVHRAPGRRRRHPAHPRRCLLFRHRHGDPCRRQESLCLRPPFFQPGHGGFPPAPGRGHLGRPLLRKFLQAGRHPQPGGRRPAGPLFRGAGRTGQKSRT